MATGGVYRNGSSKAPNLRTSSSFKSKLPASNVRRSIPGGATDSGELSEFSTHNFYTSDLNVKE